MALVAAMLARVSELALRRMPTASRRVIPARTDTSSSVSAGSGFLVFRRSSREVPDGESNETDLLPTAFASDSFSGEPLSDSLSLPSTSDSYLALTLRSESGVSKFGTPCESISLSFRINRRRCSSGRYLVTDAFRPSCRYTCEQTKHDVSLIAHIVDPGTRGCRLVVPGDVASVLVLVITHLLRGDE